MKNSNNELKRKINKSKNNGNALNDIRKLISKKYSKIFTLNTERYNKSIINNKNMNMNNNEKKLSNKESFDFNNKEKKNINSEKSQRKFIIKSRNIESNTSHLSSYLNANNKNIINDNSLYPCLTSRKTITKESKICPNKYIKEQYNTTNNNNNKNTKKLFNCNNNNLITNNEINRINKNKLLINKTSITNYSLNNYTNQKKENFIIIKYYFLLWKEKTEKRLIIKNLIKHKLEYADHIIIPSEIDIPMKNMQKIKNIKMQHFIKIIHLKGLGLLISKIINKCTLYKYFLLYNHYINKIRIFKHLKLYLKFRSKFKYIYKYLDKKSEKKEKSKYKSNIPKKIKYRKQNLTSENYYKLPMSYSHTFLNKNELYYRHFNEKKEKNYNNSNKNSKLFEKIKINRCINNKICKRDNINNNTKYKRSKPNLISIDSNLTMQINQLKMIFNLIELHNKGENLLNVYFKKWKENIKDKFYFTCYSYKAKNKYFPSSAHNRVNSNSINLSTGNTVTNFFSPLNKRFRNISYKERIIHSSYKKKIFNDNRNDDTHYLKMSLNDSAMNLNNKDFINMIYKKKLLGNRISRNNISNDYSSLLEYNKKSINNEFTKIENSYNYNCLYLSQNNLNYPTIDNSSIGDKYFKTNNKIEEREIFFNKQTKENNQLNITSYSNKNSNEHFGINYYYKNIPRKKIMLCEKINSNRNIITTAIDKSGKEFLIKKKYKKNKTFDFNKNDNNLSYFLKLLIPIRKTI